MNKNEKDFDLKVEEILDEENSYQDLSSMENILSILEELKNRKIYLFGEINKESVLNTIVQIHSLEDRSNEDIEILINSDGGYVVDCLALIDVMNFSNCDFKTIALGTTASAACLIISNGTEGKRFAGKNTDFMFHEVYGDIPDFRISNAKYHEEEAKKIQNKFTSIFAINTGKTKKEIEKTFYKTNEKDRFFTSKEAKEFGIIDKILKTKIRHKKIKK